MAMMMKMLNEGDIIRVSRLLVVFSIIMSSVYILFITVCCWLCLSFCIFYRHVIPHSWLSRSLVRFSILQSSCNMDGLMKRLSSGSIVFCTASVVAAAAHSFFVAEPRAWALERRCRARSLRIVHQPICRVFVTNIFVFCTQYLICIKIPISNNKPQLPPHFCCPCAPGRASLLDSSVPKIKMRIHCF